MPQRTKSRPFAPAVPPATLLWSATFREATMDLGMTLNVAGACAALLLIGAILFGAF
jgi:hypothetical protein